MSVLQPTTAAIVARVTATWRPVAWSACSAITDAIPSSVVVDIDTRAASAHAAKRGERAHSPRPTARLHGWSIPEYTQRSLRRA